MNILSKETVTMMGYQPPAQENLFSMNVSLENRVRQNHVLRSMRKVIDFDFIYKEVEDKYGTNGNVSVPPVVILKLMLLLVFYNVRSERELMETLPERLDWLWFLGYTLDSPIPDHSVLSKARKRWGQEVFKSFFERIVVQCVHAGLVDGTKIFMDGSLIDADASNSSVIDTTSLKRHLHAGYKELEKRLDDKESPLKDTTHAVNTRYVSTTDPDASIVRHGRAKPKLRYKTHRAVDSLHEIVTAVEVTPGAVDEGSKMASLIENHEATTNAAVDTVVADSQYGTKGNLLICYDKKIRAHMPVIKVLKENDEKDIFPEEKFSYDPATDTCSCPAGKILKKRTFHENKQNTEYAASRKDCASCSLRAQCTKAKGPRMVQRHIRKNELDHMLAIASSYQAKLDLKTRKHLMERSFAHSTRYRFDRAKWRGLWKVSIQEYLVSTILNIRTLIRYGRRPTKGVLFCTGPFMQKSLTALTVLSVYLSMNTICDSLLNPNCALTRAQGIGTWG